jgi:hypothetical protein
MRYVGRFEVVVCARVGQLGADDEILVTKTCIGLRTPTTAHVQFSIHMLRII